MLGTLRKAEYAELMILFFIQAAGMSIWFVPLGPILDGYGLHGIKALAFASSSVAAFISPLAFGAMADRHASPAKVLRGLALASAVLMTGIGAALQHHCPAWAVLLLIQIFYLAYSPMFSISTALVLARLSDARKEFGPIRSLATFGWMAGALLIGCLSLDRSALACYLDAVVWALVAAFTFLLPALEVPSSAEHLSWHERLGLDALTLLKDRPTRVVFLTTTFLNIPLAAFYPYSPTHLHDLGFQHTSAWMSCAQITEVLGMFGLVWLLANWPFKWIFAAGIAIGVVRFTLSALDTKYSLLLGITLHGASYVLVYITAQIYLDQHIAQAWRSRAQALMTLMNTGFGSLFGYLGSGWLFDHCTASGHTDWRVFWGVLTGCVGMVMAYFLVSFRQRKTSSP